MTPNEEVELALFQRREVDELRQWQLDRDGQIYDPLLKRWILAEKRISNATVAVQG